MVHGAHRQRPRHARGLQQSWPCEARQHRVAGSHPAMSEFYDKIDEILGEADSIADIVVTVRKCWLYDFADDPVLLWDGQGNFTDTLGREWLGTVDANGTNHHETPGLQDGRDGTSASYTFGLTIPNSDSDDPLALYE